MTIQVHNPMPTDVRLGDKLYDIANDILWHCDDLSREMPYCTIRYKHRELIYHYQDRFQGYILIRNVKEI